MDRSISVSMAMRKRGRLDCVLLDRTEHLTAFGGAVWNRLIELLEDGTLLSLGVSVRTPVEAHLALDNRDVSHLQLPFNVLDWRWLDCGVVDRVRARAGVTVHARNILLHGLLAFADLTKWPVDDEVCPARMLDDLQMLARQFGRASIPELCIAYVRGQDWIDGIVLDPGSDQHDCEVRSSLQPPLSLVECAALATRLPRLPERFFAE